MSDHIETQEHFHDKSDWQAQRAKLASPRSILFLTIYDRRGASSRYRAYQFEEILAQAGFSVSFVPPLPLRNGLGRILSRLKEEYEFLKLANAHDIIIVQKRLFSIRFLRRLRALDRPILFDFDDAIFTSPFSNRSALTSRRVEKRFRSTLSSANTTIVGNTFLAEHARAYTSRVEILPTVVDPNLYPQKQHHDLSQVTLGWIGSKVTLQYLNSIGPVVAKLMNLLPDYELRLLVISDVEYKLPGVEVINRRWSEETEIQDLLDIDIGVMPLTDNVWTKGKCGFKAIQYMAAGIPAVCSAVGANNEILGYGESGFLCHSNEEWVENLRQLIETPELRRHFGAAGRTRVEESYSTKVVGRRLATLLTSISRHPD